VPPWPVVRDSAIASLIFLGVVFAVIAKRRLWKNYDKEHPCEPFGVITWVTWFAFVTDVGLAAVFGATWIVVICNGLW